MAKTIRIDPKTLQTGEKLRVAAYCRVSSNSADQLNSYARQISVYTALINSRSDWILVEVFADEGITGTSAEKRPDFLLTHGAEHGLPGHDQPLKQGLLPRA